MSLHRACRSCEQDKLIKYQVGKGENEIVRPYISDNKVANEVEYKDYSPVDYTSPIVLANPVWADPIKPENAKWNEIDGKIDRRSHEGRYHIVDGLPQNPKGRTGIKGRGLLGKWGPNHAADPIVTRWKINKYNKRTEKPESGKNVLQFVAIQRGDTGEWALPGGMCDPGESVSLTLKREFMEEALNSEDMDQNKRKEMKAYMDKLFHNGTQIYKGYVDDPRNTDNAWMETIAVNFHDDTGKLFSAIKLEAGDDAKKVKWMDIGSELKLYASHKDFIQKVAEKHNAHW